jgi:demethylmenaquinone methyltransferase/2-methoxy-6-polyprenyl-1,4-benzoquinol methylase
MKVRTPFDPSYLRDLFNRSARYYDSVNSLTSMGQVAWWRKETVALTAPQPGDRVLDAFAGTGGLAERVLPYLGPGGELVLADLSPAMLHEARARLGKRLAARGGTGPRVTYVEGDILRQELGLGEFDVVLLGWGLRYVPDVQGAVTRVRSFVRIGGRLGVLEFTRPKPWSWAVPAQLYFRHVLPRVGSWLAGDPELHQYLRISSAAFADGESLARLVGRTGLTVTGVRGYLGGLVTIVAATDLPPDGVQEREGPVRGLAPGDESVGA